MQLFLKLSLFLIIFRIVSLNLEVVHKFYSRSQQSLLECVVNICDRFMPNGDKIVYFVSLTKSSESKIVSKNQFILYELHNRLKWTIISLNGTKEMYERHDYIEYYQDYIIQINNFKDFRLSLKFLQVNNNWNPHGRFLILITTAIKNPSYWAIKIIRSLTKAQVVNIIIVVAKDTDPLKYLIYSWYPFYNGSCGKNYQLGTRLIDNCYHGNFLNNIDLYENKLVPNFNQCEINVRTVPWPPFTINIRNNTIFKRRSLENNHGYDANILSTASQKYNLKFHYIISKDKLNWGYINLSNPHEFSGNLKYLQTQENDIAIGGYPKNLATDLYLDSTVSYFQEALHFCVPNDPITNGFEVMTKMITKGAWCLLLITYFIVTILLWLSARNSNEKPAFKGISNCFLHCYGILIGESLGRLPITIKAQILTSMMMLCSLYLLSAYETLLLAIINDSGRKQNTIETIDDIYAEGLKIYFLSKEEPFLGLDDLENSTIYKWERCSNIDQCLRYVTINRDSAICSAKSYIDFITNSDITSDMEPLLYCFKQPYVVYPIAILMRKGFLFYGLINNLTERLITHGFFIKWNNEIRSRKYNVTHVYGPRKVLLTDGIDMVELKPVFIIFLIGTGISFIVFLLELMLYRIKKYADKKKREKLKRHKIVKKKVHFKVQPQRKS